MKNTQGVWGKERGETPFRGVLPPLPTHLPQTLKVITKTTTQKRLEKYPEKYFEKNPDKLLFWGCPAYGREIAPRYAIVLGGNRAQARYSSLEDVGEPPLLWPAVWPLDSITEREKWVGRSPMTRDIYDLFHVVRFFDPAVLGNMGQFNKFFVNRILQN